MNSSSANPACPNCEGTGWKPTTDTATGVRRVGRCDCTVEGRAAKLLAHARIPARYEHCELANFHTEFENSNRSLSSARLSAGKFIEEYPLDRTGLMFIGSIGVGKTHLAVGIIRALITEKGIQCLFCDYRELLKEIQNSYNPTVQATEMGILQPIFDAEVLVLDELGAVKPTEWVWDTVSHILNTRYNNKRTTIITTNYSDQPASALLPARDLASRAAREETLGDRIGERMRSRLHEMCRKIEMTGEDLRQRVRSASFR